MYYDILQSGDIKMSKNKDWLSALQHNDETLKRLCGATTALSQLSENTAWARMSRMDQRLLSATGSAFTQFAQMNNWYKTIPFDLQTRTLNLLGDSLSSGHLAATKLAATPTILAGISQMGSFATTTPIGMFSATGQLAKTLRLYQAPNIVNHMDNALSHLASFDTSILEVAKAFDFSNIEVHDDGTIIYGGIEYDSEEISAVLDTQIEIAKKPALREQLESLKQRLWFLLLILNIVMFLPQIPETVDFYCDTVAQIQGIIEEKSSFCFTIRERSILREGANSNTSCIRYLPYDTPLEILDVVPRWYQVKYTDENGVETIGWISKISVELEE